ncbi:alpha/beta hydrolase [Gaetbulibacter sp. M240]|uniref:alpha/beta fold hydrolase n=1 Tax=Gaetbulibacter sp. M240 TaxID=3126511 RepID=UPI00374E2BB4
MKKIIFFTICLLFDLTISYSQESLPYESKIADLGEIQMEYMDYGGDGPALIMIQDFHNYYEGPYKNPNSPMLGFNKSLSKEFHVIEPLRRGYGKSTDTKWGYDVATLSEDLILFMKTLNIEKAFLYGRYPGNQEMTWLAEYYPEKIIGLIYYNNPLITVGCTDPEVLEHAENTQIFSPDFNKEKLKRVILSRSMWRPTFLTDTLKRISIPTIRFINPDLESTTLMLWSLETGDLKLMSEEDWPDRKEEQQYIKELLQDTVRYKRLHQKLIDCNPSEALEKGMKQTFGKNLITKIEPEQYKDKSNLLIFNSYLQWQLENIIDFKKEIEN